MRHTKLAKFDAICPVLEQPGTNLLTKKVIIHDNFCHSRSSATIPSHRALSPGNLRFGVPSPRGGFLTPLVARVSGLAFGLVLSALTSADAFAQEPHPRPRSRDVHLVMLGAPWWDIGYVTLGGALGAGGLALSPPTVQVAPLDGLGGRAERHDVGVASDVVLYGGMLGVVALGAISERWGEGSRGLNVLRAPLILGESAIIALGVVSLLKNAVGECRPRAWDDASGQCVGTTRGMVVREDRVAFPSGHTAPLAAMAGAALGMMVLPSRARVGYWPVLVTASALAIANFTLRVVAGAHSWVDTATGFALGAGLGFGTAALHTVTPSARWTVGASPTGVTLAGTFD